jgi:hypothetical protein
MLIGGPLSLLTLFDFSVSKRHEPVCPRRKVSYMPPVRLRGEKLLRTCAAWKVMRV